MAAGKGTRMHSDLPKVLHPICGMSMAELIVHSLKKAGAERIVTVVGFGHEQVEKTLQGQCEFALQQPQLGTGHAVMQAKQLEGTDGITVVANGDVPCMRSETFGQLYDALNDADMAVLIVRLEDPSAYGRVVISPDGSVEKIVEFKDCNADEKAIHEINTGIYAFDNRKLFECLKLLKNDNAQKEYYITDLVELFKQQGYRVKAVEAADQEEVQGVNDCSELAQREAVMRSRINESWMKKGVTMINPECTYIGPEVEIGKDVILYPNVTLYGKTVIGDGVTIYPNVFLKDEIVEAHQVLK
jgi:bifunctional UDP-N-acetylglucosamine pyrophosphorylase/glucosamine-1-phosphate N-acetyltransferase